MTAQGLNAGGLSPRCAASASQNAESRGAVWAPVPSSGLGQAHREDGRDQETPDPNQSVPKDFP
jgi:hypothetical protein